MLKVSELKASYGDLQVLWDISIEVGEGEFVVLLGANGAGKTTTLRSISGIIPPKEGKVELQGRDITGLSADRISRMGISYITEDLNLFGKMTVRENLLVGAHAVKDGHQMKQSMGLVMELFPRLEERRDQLAGTLSGGERKMVAIGRGLMSNPTLLLVDEPSLGLSPKLTAATFSALKELNNKGTSILLVEQHLGQALEMAQRGYILDHGRVVMSGRSADLKDNAQVKAVYLGL